MAALSYLFLLPAAVIYALFVLVPLVRGFHLSFYSWDGIGERRYIGLDNYSNILADPVLRSSFVHSFILIFFFALIPITGGLVATAVLSRTAIRGFRFFRTVFFLPQVLSLVAVGAIFRWVYAPDGGLNVGLSTVGLGSLQRGWLGHFDLALPAVGLVGTWVLFGLCLVLFLAGVQKIPTTLYDAARVDGAGAVREFFAVTLPGLRNEVVVALVLTIMAALRSFDIVFVLTHGGPGNSTTVPAFLVYRQAFAYGESGAAAALGVTLALLIIGIVVIVMRLEGRAVASR